MAHCRDGGRPSWRPVIEVLRANRLPLIEAAISSITRRRGDWVRWRPVFEQVLPCRSRSAATESDPIQTFYRTTQLQTSELQLSVWHNQIALLCLDPCLFDNRPPFFGISFSHCL
jgi:hypothetical protein